MPMFVQDRTIAVNTRTGLFQWCISCLLRHASCVALERAGPFNPSKMRGQKRLSKIYYRPRCN
jgi:hypothetical protein